MVSVSLLLPFSSLITFSEIGLPPPYSHMHGKEEEGKFNLTNFRQQGDGKMGVVESVRKYYYSIPVRHIFFSQFRSRFLR